MTAFYKGTYDQMNECLLITNKSMFYFDICKSNYWNQND